MVVEFVRQLLRRNHLWQQGGAARGEARLEGTEEEKRTIYIFTTFITLSTYYSTTFFEKI